jgi:sec-independent protein translocase protein TatA
MLPIAMIGQTEILIIAGVIIILFGAKKIPELARGLGEGIGEFKKATKQSTKEDTAEPKPADSEEA